MPNEHQENEEGPDCRQILTFIPIALGHVVRKSYCSMAYIDLSSLLTPPVSSIRHYVCVADAASAASTSCPWPEAAARVATNDANTRHCVIETNAAAKRAVCGEAANGIDVVAVASNCEMGERLCLVWHDRPMMR